MERIKIILADNEALQLPNAQAMIEKLYPDCPVFLAMKVEKLFEIIKKHNENIILLIHKDFPVMNGMDCIAKIKKENLLTDSFFILTSTYFSPDEKREALIAGVDSLMFKPYDIPDLLPALKNANRILRSEMSRLLAINEYKSIKENFDKEILKLKEIIDLILQRRIPNIQEKSENIEKMCLWIADKYSVKDEMDLMKLSLASKLLFTGRLMLDDKQLKEPIMKDGRLADPRMKEIPVFAKKILSRIKGYDRVVNVIYDMYENFDGTGFPEGKIGTAIPKLSRILRVVSDFYDLLEVEKKSFNANEKIMFNVKRLYDHIAASYIDQYLAEHDPDKQRAEAALTLKELQVNMVISRSIITKEGLVLLGHDTQLTQDQIDKIRDAAKTDGIIGSIYIYDIANTEARAELKNNQ